MMRGQKKKEFDVFGILLGIIIGCLMGFFLSGRLNLTQTKDVYGGNITEEKGMVYLLQIGRFSDPASAKTTLDQLKAKSLNAIKVEEVINQKVYYYIYGDISNNSNNILKSKEIYESAGFDAAVRSKYMFELTEAVQDNLTLKNFWEEAIDNLFKSLQNEEIIISEQYQINPENVEIFSYFMTLKGLKNDNLKIKYRLEVYRVIIETLS